MVPDPLRNPAHWAGALSPGHAQRPQVLADALFMEGQGAPPAFGVYPDVSLKTARMKRDEARLTLAQGGNKDGQVLRYVVARWVDYLERLVGV